MAALASRAVKDGSFVFFRQSFTPFRALSTSSSAADVADPKKSKRTRRKKKNLFEVAQFLPNWGIGFKMAKNHWRDVSYEITRINLYKDGRHGKAWGIRHKAGLPVADSPVKLSGVHKRGWKYFPSTNKTVTSTSKVEQIEA